MLSMTTDYASSTLPPEPYLRRIAAAGFSHIHWCHQWNTAYLYEEAEIERLAALLGELGLRLLDLHTLVLDGRYCATAEKEAAEKGFAVLANRVRMAARLGSDTVVLHPPEPRPDEGERVFEASFRLIDRLREVCAPLGVRLAFENLFCAGTWEVLERILDRCDPAFAGLCYDSGHGNLVPGSLDRLERLRGRLFSVHLHDNDGTADQHLLPFAGTVDWERLASILAASSYRRPISMESNTRVQVAADEAAYLAQAFAAGRRLDEMVNRRARRG